MAQTTTALNIEEIRADFPILHRKIKGAYPLVYLDSAATSQKPQFVLDAMANYYINHNANIHRGVHTLAEEATILYEDARGKIAQFIHAQTPAEIIYTRNTTESINLVAKTWGKVGLKAGDTILLTEMEHHSNLVPWQMLSAEMGMSLAFIPVLENGVLDLNAYQKLLQQEPRLVCFTHMSNVLGTINPAREMIEQAHKHGAIVLVDGAQAVPHLPVDVQELDADFYAFSAHKMLGPTGIGILYGKKKLLEKMPPFLGGGDMIREVHLHGFTANELPYKFEAGTPAIAEAIGLGAATDYLEKIGMGNIHLYELEIFHYAYSLLLQLDGIKVFGSETEQRGGVLSFQVAGVHPHDVAQILDSEGIAVRAGHHCAMPLHNKFNIPATIRASFYLYNTTAEVDLLVSSLKKVKKIFN
ncbi:MAG: cysteine desulfurase [Anaerolinea sp.]|nr:cysteine desulfurase [Anaerolinea sp.]